MITVGSEESEGDDLIRIMVDEVAGGRSQPQAVQREEKGAGRKRKREGWKVTGKGYRMKRRRWKWSLQICSIDKSMGELN